MSEKNELMDIVRQTALNVAGVSEQMGILQNSVKGIKLELISVKEDLASYKARTDTRMQNYEDCVRVTRTQAQDIRNAIHARAAELLDITYENGIVVGETALHNDKYYRSGFISKCYTDARKQSRLGTPYYETLKRDYRDVLDYINEWVPLAGIEGYKVYLDARRKR